jgi:hypothetical protein
MSGRLEQRIQDFMIVNGGEVEGGKVLSQKLGIDFRTFQRWKQKGVPSEHKCYRLALACGFSKEEALEIAKECPSERTRRSA